MAVESSANKAGLVDNDGDTHMSGTDAILAAITDLKLQNADKCSE